MNPDAMSPVVARRRLMAELRRLRALRKGTQEEAIEGLEWSVSRYWDISDRGTVIKVIKRPFYAGASARSLIALIVTILSVVILAALARISATQSFALRVIEACLKHGRRQEPSAHRFPVENQTSQGMLAAVA